MNRQVEKSPNLKQQRSQSDKLVALLSELTDEKILEIIKPASAKFIIYLHKDMKPVVANWRSNTRHIALDESILIVGYADTIEDAKSQVEKINKK